MANAPLWIGFFLLLPQVSLADQSDFLSLCKVSLQETPGSAPVCEKLNQQLFSNGTSKELNSISPQQVGAPAMPIDKKISFIAFNDPNHVAGAAYCYFVFRKWIDPTQMSPDQLGLSSSGFSVLNEELGAYQKWLKGAGKSCQTLVEKESGVPVTNLEASLKGFAALIGLNPLASVRARGANFQGVMEDLALTLNHERIHAFQVLCPQFEKWGQAKWKALSAPEKQKVKAAHPGYNWEDLKIAGREYAAFQLENQPQSLPQVVGPCGAVGGR